MPGHRRIEVGPRQPSCGPGIRNQRPKQTADHRKQVKAQQDQLSSQQKCDRASVWTKATAELRTNPIAEKAGASKSPHAASAASEIGSCKGVTRSSGRVLAPTAKRTTKVNDATR